MPSSVPLIICFGDSLTAGFQSPTLKDPAPRDTPYGKFLQDRLQGHAIVCISGICGERTAEMVHRFERDVVTQQPAYVVILGGTNDLGWNVAPREIMANLRWMYEHAGRCGIQPVALTVPSLRGCDEYIGGRYELNALILTYCKEKTIRCVDVFGATAETASGRLAERYSNDGLHLTASGYQLIANLLYEEIFKTTLST